MNKYAVIVAGGIGHRMGTQVHKQFLHLQGKSLLWHTLTAFLKAYNDLQIILVLPQENLTEGESITKDVNAKERIRITIGGSTRFHSVQNGLGLIKESSIIFIHDGVRCLISQDLIYRCYEQALTMGSAIPAVAATDSIRIVDATYHSVANRNDIRIIQTPQTFLSSIILPAYQTTYQEAFTDEATVVEAAGQKIFLINGDYENIKITRSVDLLIAESILTERSMRNK